MHHGQSILLVYTHCQTHAQCNVAISYPAFLAQKRKRDIAVVQRLWQIHRKLCKKSRFQQFKGVIPDAIIYKTYDNLG